MDRNDDRNRPRRDDLTTPTDSSVAVVEHDENRDPITGEPGSHPVGTGAGSVGGGVVGAAIGAAAGPLGALIGGAIGAVAGGAAGHVLGEKMDPTDEAAFREHHKTLTTDRSDDFDRYRPAYQYGSTARRATYGTRWEDLDRNMESEWNSLEGRGELSWTEARPAARNAWDRTEQKFDSTLAQEDDYWRQNFRNQSYVGQDETFETYRPAYRFGAESRLRNQGSRFEDTESRLMQDWERRPDRGNMTWDRAKQAVRDGWHRVENAMPGDADHDGR